MSLSSAVSGTVSDSSGNPIAQANVSITDSSGATVFEGTTDSNGDWSTSLGDDDYELTATSEGFSTESKTFSVSGSAKTVNISLSGGDLTGVVRYQDGQPVPNATVKALAVNYSALNVSDPSEVDARADELLQQAQNVTPPNWTAPENLDLTSKFRDTEGKYVAVHTKSDWELDGYRIKEIDSAPTIGADPKLSTPRVRIDEGETAVLSVWDATNGGLVEDNADEDLPGTTTSGTVVVEQVGPGGESLDTRRVKTSGTVKLRSLANPTSKTHESAAVNLPSGFYRVYPESNPASSTIITVGDPQSRIEDWQKDLNTSANELTDHAKQIRERIDSHKFEPITTTTDSDGRFGFTINDDSLETAKLVAYKKPAGLDKDPRNVSLADMRTYYNTSDYNGSFVIPANSPRAAPPESNVTVRVREASHPPMPGLDRYANISDQFWELMQNNSYSDAVALIQSNLAKIDDPKKRQLLRNLQSLAEQNEQFREQYNDNLGGDAGETIIRNVEDTDTEELENRVGALQETISELRSTIDSGTVESDVGNQTASLTFPFDTDLTADQVAVLVHYSNGTTETLNPQNSSYVSIDNSLAGGDAVRIEDYPLGEGDAAVANFDVTVANSEGVGRASKQIQNPTFDGEIPSLAGIDLSTLQPGPSETVSMTVAPDDGAKFKRLSNVTVYGPSGSTVASNVTNGRTAEFTTEGKGIYHIEAVYSNLDGDRFTTTFQLTADEIARDMPAGVRIAESTIGTYALTGDGLDSGSVELTEGGSKVTVFAVVQNDTDVPNQLHVYTHGVSLPPDSTLNVNVVRGTDRRAVSETVGVSLHMASVPEGAYVYRNDGQPLPDDEQTQYGKVERQSDQTVIRTYTDNDGTVSVETQSNPGWWAKAVWTWRTTVPGLALPTIGPLGVGGASMPVVGIAGIAVYRRRRQVQ